LRHFRPRQRGIHRQQWYVLPALCGLLQLAGCRHLAHADPQTTYNRAYAELVQGHLLQTEEMASAARQQFLNSDATWSYRFRLLQAEALTWQGRSQDVVNLLQQSRQSFTPSGDLAIKQALLLSVALPRLGQTEQSDQQLARATALSLATHSAMQAEVFRTTGQLQARRGEQQQAIASFHQSLDLARAQGDRFLEAADLSNIGKAYLQAEHIDEALDWFNAAAKVAESLHAGIIAESVIGNAGWAYYDLGDFDRALASFREAEAQARILGSSDNQILWLQSAGLSLYKLGEMDAARSNYEQALAAAQKTGPLTRVVETQTSLGLLYLQLGQLNPARSYADQAVTGAKRLGDAAVELDAQLLQTLIAAQGSSLSEGEESLARISQAAVDLPSLRWQIENAYAGLYSRNQRPQQADTWFRRSIQTFEAQRASVQSIDHRLPFFANGDALYRDYADFLIANGHSDQALILLDNARARTLEEGLAFAPAVKGTLPNINPQQIAARSNATILFYSLGPQASYGWAISPKQTRFFSLPSSDTIAAHINRYQTSILKSADPLRENNADAQWLYQTLVAPAEPLLQSPQARIFLVRNGSLSSLNFDTLLKPGAGGLHYWLEDVRLTSVSSLRLLARSAPHGAARQGKLLLLGNPNLASAEYPLLTNAAAEVASVTHSFTAADQTALTGAAAVPAAYAQSHPDRFAYIHFVAHGTASTLRPLDSAIILSASQAQPDAFRLYARDIVRQPIAADLVTISACYGSGLRDFAGEGLVGLAWAFLRAGAHNVIGATWAVDDASTAQLMDHLYQQLASAHPPDEALRQAKLALLHSDGVYRKPLYWAGFQLYAGS
jgi:CHAT domain-containing protein/tetratricopeptide (TPR) repeat protein